MIFVPRLLRQLGDRSRAIDNARGATTQLTHRRVEREEVAIFLDQLQENRVEAA